MNEYNLQQQIAKLQKILADVPAHQAKLAELLELAHRNATQLPPELLAAERALNSNSIFLMQQRLDELKAVMAERSRKSDEAKQSGDAALSKRLWDSVMQCDQVRSALHARIVLLEKRAEEKAAAEVERAKRRAEREEAKAQAEAFRKADAAFRAKRNQGDQ